MLESLKQILNLNGAYFRAILKANEALINFQIVFNTLVPQ